MGNKGETFTIEVDMYCTTLQFLEYSFRYITIASSSFSGVVKVTLCVCCFSMLVQNRVSLLDDRNSMLIFGSVRNDMKRFSIVSRFVSSFR